MSGELVLVTGATGFIASHVVQLLQKEGYHVRGTVRSLKEEAKIKPLYDLCPDARYPLNLVEANLMDEESWVPAVKGCKYVIHLASPNSERNPKDQEELIKPAVNGTLAVLKACDEGVKRVVLTSSVAAINDVIIGRDQPYTEADWSIGKIRSAYNKSKTIAEKAAWDFVADLPEDKKFELAVINPGAVYGPLVCRNSALSLKVPRQLMEGEMPYAVKFYLGVVDVRDVAQAHINAMTFKEAAGHRHILVAETMTVQEMAFILKEEFQSQGYNIPASEIPDSSNVSNNAMQEFSSNFKEVAYDNSRMQKALGIKPRSVKSTLIDTAYSMIEAGYVRKTKG